MADDYERSTIATALDRLPDPLRSAIQERIASALLTVPENATAFLTQSRRLKRGGFLGRITGTADQDAEHQTAMVVGPRDVLVATHGEHRGTAVLVGRLEDLETVSLPGADGISIDGFPASVEGGGTGRGSVFVGLGPPAADAARDSLTAAIKQAKGA
jgi:hypothetical protein